MRAIPLILLLIASRSAGLAASIRYRVVLLPSLPGGEGQTRPADLNNLGQVCGESDVFDNQHHAFVWHPTTGMIDLGTLPNGLWSEADRINDLGQVAGRSHRGGSDIEAIRWAPSEGMVGLGDLPGSIFGSWGRGINGMGHVAGWSITGAPGGGLTDEAFLWTPDQGMVGLGDLPGAQFNSSANDINDSGWITGWSISARGGEAFLWTPGDGWMSLDSPGESEGVAINNLGQIVGTTFVGTRYEGFLWTPGVGMITLGVLEDHPSTICHATGINELGQVVGYCHWDNPNLIIKGFIWDAPQGIRSLNDLLDPCTLPPPPLDRITTALAINNRGQIVTVYTLLNPFLPGDLDEDGDVDLFDLTRMLHSFGQTTGATYADGDIEGCDGDVDLRDLTTLLSNFGETLEP